MERGFTCPSCDQDSFLWFLEQNGRCSWCGIPLTMKNGQIVLSEEVPPDVSPV